MRAWLFESGDCADTSYEVYGQGKVILIMTYCNEIQ